MVWSTSTPAGSEAVSNGDDRIREFKTDVQGALRGQDTEGVEAIFPGANVAAPVYRYRGLKGATAARPAAGQYGLYFDETRQSLQRDSGSAWEDVGTNFPAGTKMVFYQLTVPTGWTLDTTQHDKVLRVVNTQGGGGSAGGVLTSAGHSHVVNAHTHAMPHTHDYSGVTSGTTGQITDAGANAATTNPVHTHTFSGTTTQPSTANTGAASDSGTDNVTLAYRDVIIGTKN